MCGRGLDVIEAEEKKRNALSLFMQEKQGEIGVLIHYRSNYELYLHNNYSFIQS